MRVRVRFAAAFLVGVVVAGCGATPSKGDLITEDPGKGCFPQTKGKQVQINLTVLRNSHDAAATIKSVRLPESHGISLDQAVLLPLDQWSQLVVGGDFNADDPVWTDAKLAEGATISAGQDIGLVLIVSADAHGGTSRPAAVTYTLGGNHYEAKSSNDLQIAAVGSKCGG